MTLALILLSGAIAALFYALYLSARKPKTQMPYVPRSDAGPRTIVAPPSQPTYAQPSETEGLSCFMKGLLRSARETPDMWDNDEHHARLMWYDVAYRCEGILLYHNNQYVLSNSRTMIPARTWIEGMNIPKDEQPYLEQVYQTIRAYHDAQKAKREAERLAAIRAPFERLGCPDVASGSVKME